ncbi:MAG: carbohydrate ABC transporter permease [Acidimicrobiales bacterium]
MAFFFPAVWIVASSFKQEADVYTSPPRWLFHPTLAQYRLVLSTGGVTPALMHSVEAAVGSTLLVIVLATPAAFALSLFAIKRWKDALFFVISTKFAPPVAVIVPIFIIARDIGALDKVWLLVVVYTAMNLPIGIWMLRSFIAEIPREVVEAASVDGGGLLRSLWYIVLPMALPGLFATAVICLVFAWNDFFFSLNLTATQAVTVPVYVQSFVASEGLYFAKFSAAALIGAVPVVVLGWSAQKRLVRAFTFGAIK